MSRRVGYAVVSAMLLTLVLAGLTGCGGGGDTSSSSNLTSGLAQSMPGAQPYVNIVVRTSSTASARSHGFLFFRAQDVPYFAISAAYLVALVSGGDDTLFLYSDPSTARAAITQKVAFTYVDGDTEEDASCTAIYSVPALQVGSQYYYRVCRLTEPLAPPGANAPIAGQQVNGNTITYEPNSNILSQPSAAWGPITYFTPPLQVLPANNASGQATSNLNFSWQTTQGANQYLVEVYSSSDPDGTGLPYMQSAVIVQTGGVASATLPGPFSGGQQYYWRVGARQSNDVAQPTCQSLKKRGWLYSQMRSFATALTPPPTP